MKKAPFPTHTDQLHQIKSSTLVMGGEGKVLTGVDERKGSQTIFNHIHNAKLALFKNAFDPLSTMRRDIFNEMIIDFLEDKPLKQYKDVTIISK
ncbi:hypothetical protein [Lysinibacillus sp. Ag94]|uniref:hypothetical protein n=1 Tax=Lysinibacillus sp. Ag94 TaxID=2936682 RepID=UPI00200F2FAC|nr:hypothetical protein [Lysinibacillus sp. Ag94]UPW81464.1 hypothetical protein MY533_11900 [Lysinibacillus sp. Ag94]